MPYQIDRNKCLCCHNCALECPQNAISYVGTGYAVDPHKCISCGMCASLCNVGAPAEIGAAETAVPHGRRELAADAVVLGAGAAGIVAAARLAQASGKKVIVLEKAAKYGGSGWFAGFNIRLGGNTAPPPGFLDGLAQLRRRGADEALIQMAQETPGLFFEWFKSMDPRVSELWRPHPGPGGKVHLDLEKRVYFNTKNTDRAIGPGRSTSVMERILTDHFEELGITLLTRHEAVALEKDPSGAISGVLAKDPGGEVHIACKAVICCTGGFAGNEEMLRKYTPQYYGPEGSEPTHRFAAPTNTGDVVKLGQSIGAYLDEENFTANVFGPVHHPFSFILFNVANQGEMVTVNLNGKRFLDESIFAGGAAMMYHQPRRIAWSVLDSRTRQKLGQRLRHGRDADVMADFDRDFEAEAALDTPLKAADTLEELAEQMGVDKAAFLETISRYNEFCKDGTDADFGKRPETLWPVEEGPFYAIYGKMACDGAFGGMLVNSRTEVYNAGKTGVIPGLYAAGDNASGWCMRSAEEGDHRLMATNECNWAIASGFTAGSNAAEYLGMPQAGRKYA